MITEEDQAGEFVAAVRRFYPQVGDLLRRCYVKIIHTRWGNPLRELEYVGIYCPDELLPLVQAWRDSLRRIAQDRGLGEVVCMNANHLLADPLSSLRQKDPHLWLELSWIVGQRSIDR